MVDGYLRVKKIPTQHQHTPQNFQKTRNMGLI